MIADSHILQPLRGGTEGNGTARNRLSKLFGNGIVSRATHRTATLQSKDLLSRETSLSPAPSQNAKPSQTKGTAMPNAYGYIRVSTEGQANEGVSLDAQRARIAAWCELNGYSLADVFVDAGISGKRADNRPALQAALAAVKSGSALVVYSLSRLARSTKDTIAIGERLEKVGADLVSLSEKIDTTSAAGKMVFRMLAVMAEFERDVISERTTTAMAHKRRQNQRIGRIPFGFDLAADGVSLVRNEAEQGVIALVNELHEQGNSLRKIAAELTNRGVPTKEGGTTWKHTTVARLLARAA